MLNNEYVLLRNNFIGGWFIPEEICDGVLTHFSSNKDKWEDGVIESSDNTIHVKKDIKDSIDLVISPELVDPVHPIGKYRKYLWECCLQYFKKYPEMDDHGYFGINSSYAIQYYPPNGGFKKWHWERVTSDLASRLLVFMTYLNDVPNGGTEFKYQDIITPAKKGLTLIWPAEWTHTHSGQIDKHNEKYIVTGWLNFL